MKIKKINRIYKPSPKSKPIKDCARISLSTNEQVTFLSHGSNYDFCKKSWGFYASPSINQRLINEGFSCYLIKNKHKKKYFVVVNNSKKNMFKNFLLKTKHKVIKSL